MTMGDPAGRQLGAAEPPLQGGGAAGPPGEMVMVGLPDVNGSIRGKVLRPKAFEHALGEGLPMTDLILGLDPLDVPIDDYDELGIRSGASDLVLYPEADTVRDLVWRPGWRLCFATPRRADGSPCELSSRDLLRSTSASLADSGFEALAALEYEIRIRDGAGRPLTNGISYSLGEIRRCETFVEAVVCGLEGLGVEVIAVHTEAGPGLLELNLGAKRGVQAADDAALVKFAVKDIAASLGLHASFLAKTAAGEEGSSGHLHLSLWRATENAFAGPLDEPMPPALSMAVAGMLEHMAGASLLYNPTINSYKRLVPGWFAPVNASWGIDNRSTAVRVIRSPLPAKCRIECRRPGADANPYLALAAAVASVVSALRRQAEPPAPVHGDAYRRPDLPSLPTSLEQAISAFGADGALQDILGTEFSRYFLVSRLWELKAWQQAVTDWERDRYEGAV